ncbi:hypothetical protein OCU04_008887 [Sclerotinia nivalis]|uniref:Uncharacterized protein n=1 Tax=Sclerotinia nivalis TaxID=352851 RepID=A0A9X0DG69_9HELO|nr:hypothetical protein OCU04_008887 [Sclerotinia nivalis]
MSTSTPISHSTPPIDILNTTTTPSRSLPSNLIFAPSTLYIFLADIGHESLFHWGYLLTSPPPPATSTPFLAPVTGTIFHITNITGPWQYQSHKLPLWHLSKFIPTLLFILKLYPIDSILHPALSSRLAVLGLETQLESLELSIPSNSNSNPEPKSEPPETNLQTSDPNPNSNPPTNLPTSNPPTNPKTATEEITEETTEETTKQITSRTWIKTTLHTLEEEGYISFPETLRLSPKNVVQSIEMEAAAGAGWHRMRGTVGWERSVWGGE